ncbi:MAG: hypothetical protein Q9192_006734 [Flavoplaca navasiana]
MLHRATKTIKATQTLIGRTAPQSGSHRTFFMADPARSTSSIPRPSKLPVRTSIPKSIPGIERPPTSTDSRLGVNKAKAGQIEVKRSRPGPASSRLEKAPGPEATIFFKPYSKLGAFRNPVQDEGASLMQGSDGKEEKVPQRHSSNQEATNPNARGPRPSLSDRAAQSLAGIPPSPSPRRRQSGFFPSDSPAIRPASSLGRNRPATSAGFHPPLPTSRQTSPSKSTRPPTNPPASVAARKPTNTANRTAVFQSPHRKDIAMVPTSTDAISKSTLKSSAALRETIANAKAARRAAQKYDGDDIAKPVKVGQSFDFPKIAFEDGLHVKPLHKRIASAKSDGKLDVSGMRLKVFPQEVLNMDSMTDGPAWYESVDLVRLNVADNELEDLGWDRSDQSAEDADNPSPTDVFAALQTLDLHGNHLRTLPSMLPNLENLTVLNLSRNRLKDPTRDILNNISKIAPLRILDLSDNQFSGPFPSLAGCHTLEDLNIHSNAFTSVPDELSSCTKLRTLNASTNKLSRLPHLELPNLVNLNLSSNQIAIDDLMAPETALPKLTTLDISRCRIDHLPSLPSKLPNLTTLIAFDNRIATLEVDDVRGLEILDLKGNDLHSLPAELSLLRLKNLLVGGNPMRAPRREILEGSTERLMEWLKGRLPAGVGADHETF